LSVTQVKSVPAEHDVVGIAPVQQGVSISAEQLIAARTTAYQIVAAAAGKKISFRSAD